MNQRSAIVGAILALVFTVPSARAAGTYQPDLESQRHAAAAPVGDERIVLRTELGDLVIALYPTVAPKTVEQLKKLVRLGVYDTTHFYRVEPTFVVQLSTAQDRFEPLTAEQAAAITPVPLELSELKHVRGTLQMARFESDPNGGESSFSIILADAPHLDGKYVIFGYLEWGYSAIEAMKKVERNLQNVPLQRITVTQAQVVDVAALGDFGLSRPPEAALHPPPPQRPLASLMALVAVMMACGLLTFLLAGRVTPRTTGAFGLITVLVGFFYLFIVLVPDARRGNEWIAVLLFLGSVALFKLLSRFETVWSSRPPPSGAPSERK